ncbi:MAG: hypothetical protein WA885_07150 [Phormidesmis sp.]
MTARASLIESAEIGVANPQVLAVHPAIRDWPANILRAHVVFDRPMQMANAISHIKLIAEDGEDISDALLDLTDGLWTADQRILTVLFHPGRVKTGLAAGDRYGPIFTVGRTYRLVISGDIHCADDQPLGRSYYHHFQAVSPITESFLPIADRLEVAGRTVHINTAQPLDFLSVQAHIAVTDQAGNRVPAQVWVTADGKAIAVDIADTSREKNYVLRVHPRLEDVAGNRMGSGFERRRDMVDRDYAYCSYWRRKSCR